MTGKLNNFELILLIFELFYGLCYGSSATLGSSSETSSDLDETLTSTALEQLNHAGLNMTGPIWIPQRYNVTCCRGGTPEISEPKFARNISYNVLEYIIDETTPNDENCRTFNGKFFISPHWFFERNLNPGKNIVTCKCPNVGINGQLDKNCRKLPDCKNKGIRAANGLKKCLCKQPFYGDTCEKLCDQGHLQKDITGNDYCSCIPFYQGDECKQILCLNGGKEENGRCSCLPQFLGYHCEIDTNKTGQNTVTGTRFQRFGDQGGEMFTRDISGTIFSLIMIIVLVVSMYLLMKHRMQVQTRYLHRRPDLLGACNFPVSPMTGQSCLGRRDIRNHDDSHVYPFRPIIPAGMEGPPPYVPPGQRTRRTRNEILPPLPSYEDATKMPSLRQNIPSCNDEDDQVVFNGQSSPIEENPPNLPRQESINSNSSQVSCESATNVSVQGGGRACTIEYESENCAVVHPPSADSINRNMSEQMTSTDNDQLRRESSVRKSL